MAEGRVSAIMQSVDPQTYLSAVRDRMAHGAYAASSQTLPGGEALVGYRSDFRLTWLATKLHLFVAVREVPSVSQYDLADFAAEALAYSKRTKGQFRGLQVGVGVIATLVSARVDGPAREFARHELKRSYGAFAWPAVADLGAGDIVSQKGNPKVGRVYNTWMREQIAAVLPNPS